MRRHQRKAVPLNTQPITLVPYDPDWARMFRNERSTLESALADWLSGPVEHIGSTSVPGLAAKPIIDMLAPVRSLSDAAVAVSMVVALGYAHGVHRPEEAHYFSSPPQRTGGKAPITYTSPSRRRFSGGAVSLSATRSVGERTTASATSSSNGALRSPIGVTSPPTRGTKTTSSTRY
jgi:GrpB-like predicted nucleotidyltransferase (UPF0157 family)